MNLKSLIGKTIKDVNVYKDNKYSSGNDILVITTECGDMLKVGMDFEYCNDCWLEFEGKDGTQFVLHEELKQE